MSLLYISVIVNGSFRQDQEVLPRKTDSIGRIGVYKPTPPARAHLNMGVQDYREPGEFEEVVCSSLFWATLGLDTTPRIEIDDRRFDISPSQITGSSNPYSSWLDARVIKNGDLPNNLYLTLRADVNIHAIMQVIAVSFGFSFDGSCEVRPLEPTKDNRYNSMRSLSWDNIIAPSRAVVALLALNQEIRQPIEKDYWPRVTYGDSKLFRAAAHLLFQRVIGDNYRERIEGGLVVYGKEF